MGIKQILTYPWRKIKEGEKKEEEGVKTVFATNYPDAHKYYWDALGFPTDIVGDLVIVWEQGVNPLKRAEFVRKIEEVI